MNRIIVQLLMLGFCFAIVHALRCYECKIGLGSLCRTTITTCKKGEECFSGVGTAADFLPIKMKGCLATSKCNKTLEEKFPFFSNTTLFSVDKTCCQSDLCNAAPGLSGTAGLSLILTSVSALFVAHLMV